MTLSEREVPGDRRQDGEKADLFGLDLQVALQQVAFVVKKQEVGVGPVVEVVDAEHPTALHFSVLEILLGKEGCADVCPVVGDHSVPIARSINVSDIAFQEVALNGKGQGVACRVHKGCSKVPTIVGGPVRHNAEIVSPVELGREGISVV